MRANRDCSAALDFGQLVDHYDAGRIALPPVFVGQTLARLSAAGRPSVNLTTWRYTVASRQRKAGKT
jgi:hypothetical protein